MSWLEGGYTGEYIFEVLEPYTGGGSTEHIKAKLLICTVDLCGLRRQCDWLGIPKLKMGIMGRAGPGHTCKIGKICTSLSLEPNPVLHLIPSMTLGNTLFHPPY